MANIVFVGAYAYAREVLAALPVAPMAVVTEAPGEPRWQDVSDLWTQAPRFDDLEPLRPFGHCIDLVVVAGWRKLVPIIAPTIGFHSAKLPEFPGRAPVPNAILRGDRTLTNTMLWLDEGVDTGDIIDTRTFPIGVDPDAIYRDIARTSADMLRQWWTELLMGTAPAVWQDMSQRGPLTTADAWDHIAP